MTAASTVARSKIRAQHGFTLTELLVVVVLLGMITAALSASFVTALNASSVTTQRLKESNDAQIVAGFLVRDAQAAGGSTPATGTPDTSLGVRLAPDSDCAGPAGFVVRFKWVDWSSATASTTEVASYYYDSGAKQLVRQTCTNGTIGDTLTLARNVGTTPTPTAVCVPAICQALGAGRGAMPDIVQLTMSATNKPNNAPTPYTYTLQASLRPEAQVPPSADNAMSVPLLLLGGGTGCPAGGGVASGVAGQGGGTSEIRINGAAYINGYSAACDAVHLQGSVDYLASGGTSVLAPGQCEGTTCSQYTTPIADPFASLPTPSGTCAGGSNPAPIAGVYQPGVYPQPLTVSGTNSLKANSTFFFCNDVTVSGTLTGTGDLLYFNGGNLTVTGDFHVSAPTAGPYASIVLWQRAADTNSIDICCSNNAVANFGGVIYAPTAVVNLHNGTITALGIVARAISWTGGGNGGTTLGGDPPALAITGPATLPKWTRGIAYPATQVTASGGAGGNVWSATGLPSGMAINAANGVISGTPTASGTFTPTVKVTDLFSSTDTQAYSLSISTPLAITGPATLPDWTQNRAYPDTPVTTSGGVAPFTYSAAGLPAGLTLDAATGHISGTPSTTGTSTATITVRDSIGSSAVDSDTFTINPPPSITTTSIPAAQQGVFYSTTVTATGGTTPRTWSATGLPAGLGVNAATGVVSGTTSAKGTFSVTLTVTDAAGATDAQVVSLAVAVVPLGVANVVLAPGNGQIGLDDTVTITYSKAIAVNSMCSTWAGDTTDQSLGGNNVVTVTVTDNNAAFNGHDTLTVASTTCALRFGTIDLGSPNWVTATRTFAGTKGNASTVAYDASLSTLVVTLGAPSGATTAGVPAQTIVYWPNATVTDTFTNTFSAPSYSFANRKF